MFGLEIRLKEITRLRENYLLVLMSSDRKRYISLLLDIFGMQIIYVKKNQYQVKI